MFKIKQVHIDHQNIIYFYRSDRENGYLSNLYKAPIVFEQICFYSSEHAYQFGKFRNKKIGFWAITTPYPHIIAGLGHSLGGFDIVENWTEIKFKRMKDVLIAKFTQHRDLRERLIDTGNSYIVENSTTDKIWGCGKNGKGRNMLGVLLMEVREELKTKPENYFNSLDKIIPKLRL